MVTNLTSLEKKFVMGTYKRQPLIIEKGAGCYVYDNKGKKYIDLVGGIATCSIGHGNKQLAESIKKQILKIINPSNLYYSEEQILLAKKLAKISGLGKCFFSNSGTEAVEAAIKLARKHSGKVEIIAMFNAFHGRTFGSLSATHKKKIKDPFKPLLPGFKHVPYGNVDAIEKAVSSKTAAVIVEPIQGEAGIIVPPKNYLKAIRKICDKKKVLMIVDEIQTAYGRTGKFFSYQHDNIKPDIVLVAKGLANGIPIGVTIASSKVASGFTAGEHGSTFGGNPVACKAANFTIDYILSKKLAGNAQKQGTYFANELKKLNLKVRGKGLMIGIKMKHAEKIVEKCLKKGLIINNTDKNTLRLLPPLIITKKIIDDSIKILKGVLNEN